MSMKQKWCVVGIKFNEELNKDIFVECEVEDCETVDDAVEKAKANGIKKVTGVFMHSQLTSD